MVSKQILAAIKARMTKINGELRKLKRPPKWLFPGSAQRKYTASLYVFTGRIREVISQIITPQVPKWLAGATINNPDPIDVEEQPQITSGSLGSTSIIDRVIEELNDSLILVNEILQPAQQRAIQSSETAAIEVARFNQTQYQKTTNSVLGVDIFLEEPWLETQLELFANQNAQLISNMTVNEIERVSGIVQRGLQEGSSFDQISDTIEKSFGITRRHAKLIARDQTTKLNGSLTKLRQQEVGVTEYYWETSDDERVRADHRALQGKLCRWDDPTVYYNEDSKKWEKRSKIGGTLVHPSQDVNCRCIPRPNLEGIF